jgi:hypothetical protein
VVAEATTTILDSPPVIVMPVLPDEISHEQPLSTAMEALDVDGDPVEDLGWRLVYGPSGMTIDARTGLLSWQPSEPMFEDRLTVNFAIGIENPLSPTVEASIDVVAPDRERALFAAPALRQPRSKGLLGGNFDDDESSEMLVQGSDFMVYELKARDGTYRRNWMYPGMDLVQSVAISIAAADVNGDNIPELFFGHPNDKITVRDGWTRRMLAVGDAPCERIAVADLAQDGVMRVVCAGRSAVTVLDATSLEQFWQISTEVGAYDFVVGNVDNDSQLEIVFSEGSIYDGIGLQLERHLGVFGYHVAVGDTDGNGLNEVIIADRGSAAVVRGFNATDGRELWSFPYPYIGVLETADIDRDDATEMLLGTSDIEGTRLSIYRNEGISTPAVVATFEPGWEYGIGAIAAFDIDNDGEVEIVFGTSDGPNYILVTSADFSTIEWDVRDTGWPVFPPISVGGSLARDPLHDAKPLFLQYLRSEGKARLASLDPSTGDFSFGLELGLDLTERLYYAVLTVSDYDNDGTDEALVALTSETALVFYAVDFFSDRIEWESSPIVATVRPEAIAAGDVNGDGREDLIAIAGDVAYIYDVASGRPIWNQSLEGANHYLDVVDVDGTGGDEILISDELSLTMYSYGDDGGITPIAEFTPGDSILDVTAGDIDGDGAVDIFLIGEPTATLNNRLYRLTPNLVLQSFADLSFDPKFLTLERNAHARKNVVAWSGRYREPIRMIDPTSGTTVWQSPSLFGRFENQDAVRMFDLGGFGDYRVLVTTESGIYVTR